MHSLSYGDVEASIFNASAPGAREYAARVDDEFVKLALRGLTVVVASGDDGVASFWARPERDGAARRCAERAWPEWPASSPCVRARCRSATTLSGI